MISWFSPYFLYSSLFCPIFRQFSYSKGGNVVRCHFPPVNPLLFFLLKGGVVEGGNKKTFFFSAYYHPWERPPAYRDHIFVFLENGFSLKHVLKDPVYKDHFLCFPWAVAIDRLDCILLLILKEKVYPCQILMWCFSNLASGMHLEGFW